MTALATPALRRLQAGWSAASVAGWAWGAGSGHPHAMQAAHRIITVQLKGAAA
jgi:hypothetical protein